MATRKQREAKRRAKNMQRLGQTPTRAMARASNPGFRARGGTGTASRKSLAGGGAGG